MMPNGLQMPETSSSTLGTMLNSPWESKRLVS
jgi:hypothetical protein